MGDIRNLISNYHDILYENKNAKYLNCKYQFISFEKSDSDETDHL